MLLTDARRAARTGPDGELIPLDEQDRALLGPARDRRRRRADQRSAVRAARSARTSCRPRSPPCTTRPRAPRTPTGRRSSRSTACCSGCPTTRWSRSTTRSRRRWSHGPQAGLELLDALDADARLAGHHRLDAVRAHLLETAGDRQRAIASYLAAAGKTASEPERNYLAMRAGRLGAAKLESAR